MVGDYVMVTETEAGSRMERVGCVGYLWDGWEAQVARGSRCIYLAVQNGCAVVQWSTDGLPSGGPQLQALACTLTYASRAARAYFSIWYDGTLPFHRLRPCKFRMGASTRLAAGH